MIRQPNYTALAQLAVGTVMLAIVLQTLLVMGLVTPVYVAGSSMAPTLEGSSVVAGCPRCDSQCQMGAEFAAETAFAECEHCGFQRVPLDDVELRGAHRIVIDRTAFSRRAPRRGEVVVLQNPTDGSQWSVKRVVGLPGETVAIRQGDVWIDGRPWVKSLAEQRAVRRQIEPEGGIITDDFAYNAGLSRRLNPVRDFMASMEVQITGSGLLVLELRDGSEHLKVTIEAPSGQVTAYVNDKRWTTAKVSGRTRQRLAGGVALVDLSNFDRQMLLAIDSRVELVCPLDLSVAPPAGTARPFQLTTRGTGVQARNLSLYRDVYYTRQAVDMVLGPEQVPLARDEYYLLGDNSPVSVDSRSWGGVPRRFLVGRVLGAR